MNILYYKLIKDFLYYPIIAIMLLLGSNMAVMGQEDVLEDDFELFEDEVDGESGSVEDITLDDAAALRISKIVVVLDGEIYTNPSAETKIPKGKPAFSFLFSSFRARRGDLFEKKKLERKLHFWSIRIGQSTHYSTAYIEYYQNVDEDIMENDPIPITVVISVETAHSFIYWGGNAYASIGYKHPGGASSQYFLGGNRLEASFIKNNILLSDKDIAYKKMPIVFDAKGFGYWSWPTQAYNTFMYGGVINTGLKPFTGLTFTLGSAAIGFSTLSHTLKDEEMDSIGLPRKNSSNLSFDIRAKAQYRIPYKEVGKYKPYSEFTVPVAIGWKSDDYSLYEPFDTYALIIENMFAYHLGINQAVNIKASHMTNGMYNNQPFYAKANLQEGFFNTYLTQYGISRIGSGYDIDLYIANKGTVAIFEYRAMILERSFIGLELLGFYDIGTVYNDYSDFVTNIRQTIGPGFAIAFDSPVNLSANVYVGIGGSALSSQDDGNAVSISFSVVATN